MLVSQMFPKKWVCAEDLQGREITVTIRAIGQDKVHRESGEEMVYILYFHKATKALILTRRLALAIAAILGPDTDAWMNRCIVLLPTTVRAFGKIHACIGVRAAKPTSPTLPAERLDDLEDITDDIDDDVPFDHRATVQEDEEQPIR